MAKLSVYNTIDRSQLGGKFVPLIQSGVNNYKILASDLGKEYSPGDAIEITDTGVINVNYDPDTLRLSGSGLGVKTDAARGVFGGSNGIYIASADSSIGISNAGIYIQVADHSIGVGSHGIYLKTADNSISVHTNGIKVDPSALVGKGLSGDGGTLYVVSANDSILVSEHGIKVNPWDGLSADSHGLYVEVADTTISVNSDGVKVRTGYGLIASDYGLSVRPADDSIDTSYAGIKVNPSAITGTGLVTTNGAIGVNVNTATGIIVKDNKLYLNAGVGLYTTNNTVKVKAADHTIYVSSAGISVNYGSGLMLNSSGLLSAHIGSGLRFSSTGAIETTGITATSLVDGATNIKTLDDTGYLYASATRLAGYGLKSANYEDTVLAVKAADNSIDVSENGIKVNTSFIAGHGLVADMSGANNKIHINIGSGLGTDNNGYLEVKTGDGLGVDSYGSIYAASSYTVGPGLTHSSGALEVLPANDSIVVSNDGIKVDPSALAGGGLYVGPSNGKLYVNTGLGTALRDGYVDVNAPWIAHSGLAAVHSDSSRIVVKAADNTILVGGSGIRVNTDVISGGGAAASDLVGQGLVLGVDDTLYVKSADSSITVQPEGIRVNPGNGLLTGGSGVGLCVKSANNSILVGSTGIKVNTMNIAGDGLGGANNTLYVNSGALAGDGLSVDSYGRLYVTSSSFSDIGNGLYSDNGKLSVYANSGSLGFSSTGELYVIDKDPGWGLESRSGTYYVKSADNSIGVSDAGIKVNTGNVAAAILGNGLEYNSGKLNVYHGSGLVLDRMSGKVSVYCGSGLNTDDFGRLYVTSSAMTPDLGKGLWLASDNQSLLSVYAGSGLTFDDLNRMSVYAGSGLEFDSTDPHSRIRVKPADNSIGVTDSGIRVKTYDDTGVFVGNHGVYLKSADSSIGLSTGGLYVVLHQAGGLTVTESHGLFIKLKEHSGLALGEHGLYLASSSHGSTGAICIPYGGSNVVDAYTIAGHAITIGYSSYATSAGSTVIGTYAESYYGINTVVGFEALVHGDWSSAIGYKAQVMESYSSAFGAHSYVNAKYCLSAGVASGAVGYGAVSLGAKAVSQADKSVAIGLGSSIGTLGQYSISAGYNASASAVESVVIGAQASSSKTKTVVIGADSTATGSHSIVIGAKASAGTSSIAIGYGASAGDGFICLRTYDSEGRGRDVKFDSSGYMYAANYNQSISRRFDQFAILTPPEPNSIVSINAGVQYIADKPIWVCGRVYSTTNTATAGWLYINSSVVLGCSSNNSIMDSFALPIAPGDSYEFYTGSTGSQAPILFTMDCQ